jgi:hypothetical protein
MMLKRVKQCAKCPWKKDVNPHDIPNGYDLEKHKGLVSTIAAQDDPLSTLGAELRIMACHETDKAHCVGWLNNQLGAGNNIGLRISMSRCENIGKLEVIGDQYEHFSQTLPAIASSSL